MSMTGAAHPYRREDRPAMRVPVVMPLVEVAIDQGGGLAVMLDREPYSADGALRRGDLRRVIDEIAFDLGAPLRVEVREADGSAFTDIITPPPDRPTPDTGTETKTDIESPSDLAAGPVAVRSSAPWRSVTVSAFGISGEGFTAGERVEVCVVVAHQVADDDGTARLRLPPALLADHPGVVLVGRSSGTVALSTNAGTGVGVA